MKTENVLRVLFYRSIYYFPSGFLLISHSLMQHMDKKIICEMRKVQRCASAVSLMHTHYRTKPQIINAKEKYITFSDQQCQVSPHMITKTEN